MKRIVTIQDVSCFGKCSLTVALPIISSLGVEASIIPSAVLSTHTGGFSGFTFADLTEEIPKISRHWQNINLKFDAIYTGYVGSVKQLDYIGKFFDKFGCGNNIVDPVMADHGKMYTGFDANFARQMAKLVSKADYVLPNLTETAFLLEREYVESGYDEQWVLDTARALCALGAKNALITGISFDSDKLGVACYSSKDDKIEYYFREKIDAAYHGTGDCFASAFCGALVTGNSFFESAKIAVDFTVECIKQTVGDKEHWYGVKFEQALPMLLKK